MMPLSRYPPDPAARAVTLRGACGCAAHFKRLNDALPYTIKVQAP